MKKEWIKIKCGDMGTLKKTNIDWSEELIQDKLSRNFMSESNIKYCAENLYIYNWESDLWIMTKSGYVYEFEIKISKSDFKNDFKKKTKKHEILEVKNPKSESQRPNYFYYAVPENLIEESDVPEYAGLIYMRNIFPYFEIVKQAPKLDSNKYTVEDLNLLEKFYYNYRDWRHKTRVERKRIDELNSMIDEYNEKPEKEKKPYMKLLEENKINKITAKQEGERAEMYQKMYFDVNKELRVTNRIIRRLCDLMDNNGIKYDINELYDELQ